MTCMLQKAGSAPAPFVPEAREVSELRAWVRINNRWPRFNGSMADERKLAAWVRTTLETRDAQDPLILRVNHILSGFKRPAAGRPRKTPDYVIPMVTERHPWQVTFELLKEFYTHMGRLPRTSASKQTSPAEVALGTRLRRLTVPSSANYNQTVREWADGVRAELAKTRKPRNLLIGAKRGRLLSHTERVAELEAFVQLNLRRPSTTAPDILEAGLGVWYCNWLNEHPDQNDPTSLRIQIALKDFPELRPGPKTKSTQLPATPTQRIQRIRRVLTLVTEGQAVRPQDAQQALEDLAALQGIILQ